MVDHAEASPMPSSPAVRCSDCGFAWNSAAMAEGLRLLGSCPKCGGGLEFRGESAVTAPETATAEPVAAPAGTAPHLVLGIPRR
jgi:hypothetical protein